TTRPRSTFYYKWMINTGYSTRLLHKATPQIVVSIKIRGAHCRSQDNHWQLLLRRAVQRGDEGREFFFFNIL
ncbi:MAG: hypothetical protein FWD61_19455, partial [Phycisphaerales bacterium]|nr:hypothetical protein [Phycisphaerales bacterium]